MKNSLPNSRRSGFTLIEMMVAIAILLTMLTIILVPLRLGLDSFALGKSRSETQGALGTTISMIEKDLRRAVIVFPNSELTGVTDKEPYWKRTSPTDVPVPRPPYYYSSTVPTSGDNTPPIGNACDASTLRFSNPSRIDMILARRDASGNLANPVEAGETLVTYYSRRLDVTKPYDPIDNPVELFRAEMPFRVINSDGTQTYVTEGTYRNADVANGRYPDAAACSGGSAQKNRQSRWLSHNYWGETNLEELTQDSLLTGSNDSGSHVLAMPRGLGLVLNNGNCTKEPCEPSIKADPNNLQPPQNAPFGLVPESTFATSDSDGDGKIDRVNISLAFTSFESQSNNRLRNGQPVGQQMRGSRTVDLQNIQ